MDSAADDFAQASAWMMALRKEPLPNIVRSIHRAVGRGANSADARHSALADYFEQTAPERLDYALFREFVFSQQRRRRKSNAVTLIETVLLGLGSPDPAIATGSRLVLSRLDIKHIKNLRVAGIDALNRLAKALDESQPLYSGSDAMLCDGVLIPYVKLLVWEDIQRLKWKDRNPVTTEDGKVNIAYPLATVQEIFDEVADTLRKRLHRKDDSIGDPIPIVSTSMSDWGDGVPWVRYETISAVAIMLVDLGSCLKSAALGTVTVGDYPALVKLLDRAADLVQCGWLTLRALRKALQIRWSRSSLIPIIEEREVKALFHLAEFERLRNNHVRAGQYSVFAIHQNLKIIGRSSYKVGSSWGALKPSEKSTVGIIASRLGLFSPVEMPGGGRASTPALYSKMLQLRPDMASLFSSLHDHLGPTAFWDGFDQTILRRLISAGLHPARVALRSAIKTGNLWLVMNVVHKRSARELREQVLNVVDKDLVLQYANALASVQQKAVALLKKGEDYRVSLRRLWKQIPAQDFSIPELLFLHHVKVGLTHHALSSHSGGEYATWALYESAPAEDRERFFAEFVDEVRFGTLRPLLLQDFQRGTLVVGVDEVFLSLVTVDGHVASLITFGPQKSEHETVDSRAARGEAILNDPSPRDDWNRIIEDFSMIAKDCVTSGEDIQSNPAIEGLAVRMFEAALRVNPNFKRIILHCDSMFRLIPWQHAFQFWTRLKEKRIDDLRRMRGTGVRTATDDGWLDFVLWHVPGVVPDFGQDMSSSCNSIGARQQEWVVKADRDDAFCCEVANAIKDPADVTLRPAMKDGSRLSLVCHGREGSYASRIELGGSSLSNQELSSLLGGYELATVHACHGGHAFGNALGDLGGLPAFLLTHGSSVVLASPLPVTKSPAIIVERFLSQLTGHEPVAIERAYVNALREAMGRAYYNLYSTRLMPKLACTSP